MERHYNLYRLAKRLLLWLLPFFVVGWVFEQLWLALAVGLACSVAWNFFFFQRLNRWLWQSRTTLPPRAPGAWSDIYDGIYGTLRRAQFKRRQLSVLLQRFRQAAEAIPDAGMVLSADGSLEWTNKLAQIYFGIRWPADKNIRITNLIRYPRFNKYFEKGDFREAITLISPTGDQRELELRIMPYSGTQLLVIARDVTQLRKLERMRKDFVANVSHELKTPLTVMNGYLEMLEDGESLPPQMMEKAVHDMQGQTQRMQKMVNQLLELSRMEVQTQDNFSKRVPMSRLLNDIIAELGPVMQEKRLHLDVAITPDLSVWGSEDKLRSAGMNLLTNAIKYSPEGSNIKVSWQLVRDFAEFSVIDSGPGIPLEHIPRLTERFYRVEKDRNSASGGTGLGLSIVKHALEHHRSKLQVESTVGVGSKFYFRIPPELVSSPTS
ncbi:two-component system sensor histidine kinase PhoR [Aliidiomarina shirensis]|uniref:histidine kinase n=1 Tax=Aliidiomarina shirensis TaxID=1048642 RepID=A0A432WQQ5_9GAMM|nr:phosphate regulon sensor histidine kinase PhoR [Aliidiomarina shirensis]RUO36123.1 two-component system sensor histidine kinase PhoR [Aliidiomarina shirensis]